MVVVLCPGSSPGRGTAFCSWSRHFTPIVPLSIQVCMYNRVPVNSMLYGRGGGSGDSPARE